MKTFRWLAWILLGQLLLCLLVYVCVPTAQPAPQLPVVPSIEEPAVPVPIDAPVVASQTPLDETGATEETDTSIERMPSGKTMDLMIENGHVQITGDGGANWQALAVAPSLLQDAWLPYLRMGEQSYYADEHCALVAVLGDDGQPHLYVSDQTGRWQDIAFTLEQRVMQMSISRAEEGTFYLLMVTQDGFVTLGSSSDAKDWTFTTPAYFADAASTCTSMNIYGAALMRDGTILMVTWKLDCAISTDGGAHFTYLLQDLLGIDPMAGDERVSTTQLPYEDEQGRYCVPLSDGSLLVHTDAETWTHLP